MPPRDHPKLDKEVMAKQVIDVFHEISTLLSADLDRQTISICISLIENGVNPEALATAVKELKKDAEADKQSIAQHQHQEEGRR